MMRRREKIKESHQQLKMSWSLKRVRLMELKGHQKLKLGNGKRGGF